MMEDKWLSIDEIAEYLGVKKDTVYKWLQKRDIPSHKIGKLWRFKKDEIDTWIRTGEAKDAGKRKGQS